jgi:hypothetical protein
MVRDLWSQLRVVSCIYEKIGGDRSAGAARSASHCGCKHRLTDVGLSALVALTRLECLDLEWSGVTGRGLNSIASVPSLRWVDFGFCAGVSAQGVTGRLRPAYARDSRFGESQGLDIANPWRVFATFLYCGKIYE